MQAFTDVPVKCCDCKETFLSASSLLQHFAHHVKINSAKNNCEKLRSVSRKLFSCRDKNNLINCKINHSNCEKVFLNCSNNNNNNNNSNNCSQINSRTFSSPSTSNDNSLQSLISDKSELYSSSELSETKSVISNVNVIDDIVVSKEAQQLRNKSQSKEKSSDTNNCDGEKGLMKQFCVEFSSEKMLINVESVSSEGKYKSTNLKILNNINFDDPEIIVNDFKSKERDEINYTYNNKKKLSNRKQLMPKKIERKSGDLIKIAPRPDDVPVNYGRQIQNKKSTNKKKYNCHLCSKVFGWSTDLKRHILVHTGERPYKCTKCSACFTRNFLLQKHKSKIHPSNREFIENNKLLDEKVNENLKQLKFKLTEFENNNNNNTVKTENVNEYENEGHLVNVYDDEMDFEESKLGIKEEVLDPLADTAVYDGYVNSKWVLRRNNNNIEEDKNVLNNSDCKLLTVGGPIKIIL